MGSMRNLVITLARNVWFWFVVAVVLHLAWDLSHAMAVVLAAVTTGEPPTWAMFARGELPNPSATQAKLTSAY